MGVYGTSVGACLCCTNPDYLLVDCRRACLSTWAWSFWGLQGKEELGELLTGYWHRSSQFCCPHPCKQVGFTSKVLGFIWQSRWKILANYEKDLKEKKKALTKKSPTKLHLLWRTGWRGNLEPKSLDNQSRGQRNDAARWLFQALCQACVKLRSSTHPSGVLLCVVLCLGRSKSTLVTY